MRVIQNDLQNILNGSYQLAEHIKRKLSEDYQAFGGENGVSAYYYTALRKNMDRLIELLIRNVDLSKINEKSNEIRYTDCNGKEREIDIVCNSDKTVFTLKGLLNTLETDDRWVRKDDLNKKTVNLYFKFDVKKGHDIAYLTGIPYEELPAFIKCFTKMTLYTGNPILDINDPVSDIISPISRDIFNFEET